MIGGWFGDTNACKIIWGSSYRFLAGSFLMALIGEWVGSSTGSTAAQTKGHCRALSSSPTPSLLSSRSRCAMRGRQRCADVPGFLKKRRLDTISEFYCHPCLFPLNKSNDKLLRYQKRATNPHKLSSELFAKLCLSGNSWNQSEKYHNSQERLGLQVI